MKTSWMTRCLAVASMLIGGTTLTQAMPTNPFADHVRAANDRFKDVAVARSEGYSPIACDSAPGGGGMGIHYVNPTYLKDKAPEVARPQAVMYEPEADGSLKLIAVEYISFNGPVSIEGHLMNFVNAPNTYGLNPFYEIHVWAWKTNPLGTFADDNPDVSCDAMPLKAQMENQGWMAQVSFPRLEALHFASSRR